MHTSITAQKSVAQKTAIPAKGKPPKKSLTPLQTGIVVGSVLLVAGLGYLIYWKMQAPELPPVNADTVTLAKFMSDEKYGELDFQQQFKFMQVMEDRDDKKEIRKGFVEGQLNEEQYRQAKLEAWVAQQINRTNKFLELPPGRDRIAYITDRVKKDADDDDKDKDKDKDGGNKGDKGDGDKGGDGNKGDAKPKGPELPKVDPSLKKTRLQQLPPDVREKYRQYKQAYDEEEERRDLEKKAKKAQKAATQATEKPAAGA